MNLNMGRSQGIEGWGWRVKVFTLSMNVVMKMWGIKGRFLTNVVWSFQCLRTMVLCLINPLILKTYCNYKIFYYFKGLVQFQFLCISLLQVPCKIDYLLIDKSKVICNGSLVSRTWQCVAKKWMLGNFVWMGMWRNNWRQERQRNCVSYLKYDATLIKKFTFKNFHKETKSHS
jgi:hypothetical protein